MPSTISYGLNVVSTPRISRIIEYWNQRSYSYSNSVLNEFDCDSYEEWCNIFRWHISRLSEFRVDQIHETEPSALDLGCGPGFFCALLSSLGCNVVGMDFSSKMIERAHANVASHGVPERVSFMVGDVSKTSFADDSFDLIVMRNVTWLMQEPLEAFREWHRILRPGGRLVFFDANWYRYLVDEAIDRERRRDQSDPGTLGWADDAKATRDEEIECEAIALELPMTDKLRPEWDVDALKRVGFQEVESDLDVWRKVWTPGEQAFYASSPMFMVTAQK